MTKQKSLVTLVLILVGILLACGTSFAAEKAAKTKPIKIGVLFIASGPMGGYGKHGFQSVQMAVDEINASGGILGRKVEAIYEDTKLKADVATEIVKRFIEKDKVDFIIGPTSSGVAVPVAKLANEKKKIIVLTQAAANSMTDTGFGRYQFATLSNAMMHSRSGAYYMASKPYKRWMVIGPNYNYGHESWAAFKEKLKELRPDVEFVGEAWPKLTEKEFKPFIEKIVEAKPDAVWSPLWGMDAVNFIKQAKEKQLFDKIAFAFPDGAALETLIPLGKDMPNGIFVAARYFFLTPDTAINKKFVKMYQERFKELPDYMATETYAGVYFIKAAIERAGTLNADKIVTAVEKEPLAWETPEGWKIMRKEDHAVVEDVVWGETDYSDKFGFAILKNMQAIQAEEICRTPEELRAVRENFMKRIRPDN
ncbi:MAG TPA: ABC transporter substrate-binding protein [Syntrophorhabdus sp.]|nr:ABC transporter substrate-binding protein [Pseudomonadota bacterium]NMC95126.1 ABC transporter substrate-binding protein [Syntrophorhabdus sp.]OQB78512.1 MAG: Leu/Ile/Val-binding protein precursor [Deltaproteobacteria bacterium ADurb.Bin135]HNY70630.1 ABC transporter substrate-binding protein [Syntrophorhabdus sp.]HOH27690.1 ABC transporter substrate-binding protein [Syntrophorhabdus sp.]